MQSYATLFFVVLFLHIVILSSGYGFSRRAGSDDRAIQSAHSGFVPRVGGLCIYVSCLGLIPILSFGFIPLSLVFNLNTGELTWLIISALPVFIIGLAEDLGYNMSPMLRLSASIVSSVLAIIIFKVWLFKLGIPGFDTLLLLHHLLFSSRYSRPLAL